MNQPAGQPDQGDSLKEVYAELRILQNRRFTVWNTKAAMVTGLLGLGAWKTGGSTNDHAWVVALLPPLVCLLFDVQLMSTSIAIQRVQAFLRQESGPQSLPALWSRFLSKHEIPLERLVADGFSVIVLVASVLLLIVTARNGCWKESVPDAGWFLLYYAVLVGAYCVARCYEESRKAELRQISCKRGSANHSTPDDRPKNDSMS